MASKDFYINLFVEELYRWLIILNCFLKNITGIVAPADSWTFQTPPLALSWVYIIVAFHKQLQENW